MRSVDISDNSWHSFLLDIKLKLLVSSSDCSLDLLQICQTPPIYLQILRGLCCLSSLFSFRALSYQQSVLRVACGDFGLLYPNDNLAVIGIPSDCHNGKPDSRGDRNETFLLFVSYHHQVCLNFSLDTWWTRQMQKKTFIYIKVIWMMFLVKRLW